MLYVTREWKQAEAEGCCRQSRHTRWLSDYFSNVLNENSFVRHAHVHLNVVAGAAINVKCAWQNNFCSPSTA